MGSVSDQPFHVSTLPNTAMCCSSQVSLSGGVLKRQQQRDITYEIASNLQLSKVMCWMLTEHVIEVCDIP